MQPVVAWPPGSVGRWGSPFSRPWLADLRRHPKGLTIPKGVWLITCDGCAWVSMRVNMRLAMELVSQPALLTSIPPVRPLPMLPPCPRPPHRRPLPPPTQRVRTMDFYEDGDPSDWIDIAVVKPCHTGTVWSDEWNVRLCGGGKAMLIKVSQ